MELDPLNLTQICRTCKCVAPQMRSLFEEYENTQQSPRIDEMLMACASVQVLWGDGLPTQICQICVEQLQTAFNFKCQAERIDANLRELTENLKVNEIKQEPQHSDFMEDNVYPCDICNKVFNREDSLETHKHLHYNQPKLSTIENPDNVDKYYQVDQNVNAVLSEYPDVDDCFDPQVEVTENTDEAKIKELFALGLNDEESNLSNSSMPDGNCLDYGSNMERVTECLENETDESNEVKVENSLETDEIFLEDADKIIKIEDIAGESSGDSTDSEYLPKKSVSTKIKRGRGRPRKYPLPGTKVPGRGRGRPKIRSEEKEEDSREYPCPACEEIFNTKGTLYNHVNIKHKGLKIFKCNVCDKEFSRVDHLGRHMSSHSAVKQYRCQVCTKSFNRRDYLTQHKKLHGKDDVLECDICQNIFGRADLLANHKASKHGIGEKVTVEKKYKCSLCQKGFITEKYRDIHVSLHNEEDQYKCGVCKKTFLSKTYFYEHMKYHDEQAKKYLCSECDQRFIRKDYLIVHMRRHRGEKPFKCKFCGKGFPRTSDLTAHERHHTGEKTHFCTVCGKGFGRSYSLTVHMRTHTGEKPYQCMYCDTAFAQSNDLKSHVQRHTNKKFQCELCSKSFIKGNLLTRHRETAHGANEVSNSQCLQPVIKQESPDDEPPPITIPPT